MVISNSTFTNMNMMKKLDDTLLEIAQKIAREIYFVTGLGNLFLAKNFILVSWVVFSFSYFLDSYQSGNKYFIKDVLISLSWGFFCLLVWMNIKRLGLPSEKGFQNPARIMMFDIRLTFLLNFVAMSFLSTTKPYSVFLIGFAVVLLLLSAGLYFGSIEPEDPTDSLLKRLWGKLKEACSFSPLPELA